MNIEGKTITIMGGKRSGMALARLVVAQKGRAKISEQGGMQSYSEEFRQWALEHDVNLETDGHTRDFILSSDMVVLSPGIPLGSEPVQWAGKAGIPVLGEVEFAAQFCSKPIIAVTGSNGKTTVTTLIHQMLLKAGFKAHLCGNVGYPFSNVIMRLEDADYVVLEVSSFQMESVHSSEELTAKTSLKSDLCFQGFKPYIAVILNFSQNHLDRHKDLEEYFSAKKRITINQDEHDFIVLNAQDMECQNFSRRVKAQVRYFNDPTNQNELANPNFKAVCEVGHILGIRPIVWREVFDAFKGVEHRLEKVRLIDGVEFINDSKATTAQAALWALNAIDQPIQLICGGRDKNIDFGVLSGSIRKKVKKIFAIGEAKKKLRDTFGAFTQIEECNGLEEAVRKARTNASKGDCVLLSPMCASFDMFKDYEERGRVFKEIVSKLE